MQCQRRPLNGLSNISRAHKDIILSCYQPLPRCRSHQSISEISPAKVVLNTALRHQGPVRDPKGRAHSRLMRDLQLGREVRPSRDHLVAHHLACLASRVVYRNQRRGKAHINHMATDILGQVNRNRLCSFITGSRQLHRAEAIRIRRGPLPVRPRPRGSEILCKLT